MVTTEELQLVDRCAKDTLAVVRELLALRKDAERYRWWRAQVQGVRALGSGRPAQFGYPSTMALPPVRGDIMRGSVAEHFDHAVDAAMAAAPGGAQREIGNDWT